MCKPHLVMYANDSFSTERWMFWNNFFIFLFFIKNSHDITYLISSFHMFYICSVKMYYISYTLNVHRFVVKAQCEYKEFLFVFIYWIIHVFTVLWYRRLDVLKVMNWRLHCGIIFINLFFVVATPLITLRSNLDC